MSWNSRIARYQDDVAELLISEKRLHFVQESIAVRISAGHGFAPTVAVRNDDKVVDVRNSVVDASVHR